MIFFNTLDLLNLSLYQYNLFFIIAKNSVFLLVSLHSMGLNLHKFLLGTLGAENVRAISDEAFANQRAFAGSADEAVVVPVPVLKRNEACATNTSDGFATSGAALGKELSEAVGTIRFVLS